jgi:4-hydroxy-3-methylbut-2-enyl diphosphate reductase
LSWLPLAVTTLFVFSMHLLNRVQDKSGAVRFNTPEIAAFYSRRRSLLYALGGISAAGAIFLGFWMGLYSGLLVAGMIVTGLLYTAPLLRTTQSPWLKGRSLKDLPGSKTPLVAMGWGVAASVLPVIGAGGPIHWPGLVVAFVFAASMVFWRTALSDLLDIQGDRIVGRETIPIIIGVNKTVRLLVALLAFAALMLAVSAAAGWVPRVGYWLILTTLIFGGFFLIYRKRRMTDRLTFEALMDGNLVLCGIVAAWQAVS